MGREGRVSVDEFRWGRVARTLLDAIEAA